MASPLPLSPEQLYRAFDPATLPFETTADLPDGQEIIGQQRAIDAIRFGIGIHHQGYNLFALEPVMNFKDKKPNIEQNDGP